VVIIDWTIAKLGITKLIFSLLFFSKVHCPRGTYHNVTTNTCQGCHYGMFNNMTGQIECSKCPPHYSTRRMHSKSESDCRRKSNFFVNYLNLLELLFFIFRAMSTWYNG